MYDNGSNISREALGLQGVKLHINTLGDGDSRDAYREALKAHTCTIFR